jgi:hypothetical protein
MGSKRNYVSLLSVFDLIIREALGLSESVSIRVMLSYDKILNERKFVILDTAIQKDMHDRLISWLEENIDVDDIAYGLRSNNLDVDSFSSSKDIEAPKLPV